MVLIIFNMKNLLIENFLENKVLKRKSFFQNDIDNNFDFFSKEIKNKNVLVIGGAGSIGSSYIKEILNYIPKKLIVVDLNENGLTELTRYLRSSSILKNETIFKTYPIDVNSEIFIKLFNSSDKFHVVANFAAHKHVRSEKDIFSIEAMIRNNVFGAFNLINVLLNNPPNHFFCVSTDKAANPVNIMGASKKLMESIILESKKLLKVSTARFANVAFSNGSLLESFVKRLNYGQAIPCPSDIRRFFVSPKESGQICLIATFLGESGDIFFPKFNHNDQIYFKDILKDFLEFNELEPVYYSDEFSAKRHKISNSKWPVYVFSSDTSGEKEFEEFYTSFEDLDLKKFNSVGLVKNSKFNFKTKEIIEELDNIFKNDSPTKKDLVLCLNKFVKNFEHIEKGKNLDQKM